MVRLVRVCTPECDGPCTCGMYVWPHSSPAAVMEMWRDRSRLVWLLIVSSVLISTAASPVTQQLSTGNRTANVLEILNRRRAGCPYGGRVYNPGEQVLSSEPCLNCTCHETSLTITCHLRVCPTYPVPPPPGCFIVTRYGSCCSELICDQGARRAQRADETGLFSELSEIQAQEPTVNGSCVLEGTVYADGSAMLTSSKCDYCFCIRGQQRCVQPSCDLAEDGCRPQYRTLEDCCPTDYICREMENTTWPSSTTTSTTTTIATTTQLPTGCTIGDETFPEGTRVPNYTDPCQSCFCLRGNVRCASVQCSPLLDGCLPLFQPDKCCPVSYNCSADMTAADEEWPGSSQHRQQQYPLNDFPKVARKSSTRPVQLARSAPSRQSRPYFEPLPQLEPEYVADSTATIVEVQEDDDRDGDSAMDVKNVDDAADVQHDFEDAAESAVAGVRGVGKGSVVSGVWSSGSVAPVSFGHGAVSPVNIGTGSSLAAAPATFQVRVKSGGIRVAGGSTFNRAPGTGAKQPGLFTVRDAAPEESNRVGTRKLTGSSGINHRRRPTLEDIVFNGLSVARAVIAANPPFIPQRVYDTVVPTGELPIAVSSEEKYAPVLFAPLTGEQLFGAEGSGFQADPVDDKVLSDWFEGFKLRLPILRDTDDDLDASMISEGDEIEEVEASGDMQETEEAEREDEEEREDEDESTDTDEEESDEKEVDEDLLLDIESDGILSFEEAEMIDPVDRDQSDQETLQLLISDDPVSVETTFEKTGDLSTANTDFTDQKELTITKELIHSEVEKYSVNQFTGEIGDASMDIREEQISPEGYTDDVTQEGANIDLHETIEELLKSADTSMIADDATAEGNLLESDDPSVELHDVSIDMSPPEDDSNRDEDEAQHGEETMSFKSETREISSDALPNIVMPSVSPIDEPVTMRSEQVTLTDNSAYVEVSSNQQTTDKQITEIGLPKNDLKAENGDIDVTYEEEVEAEKIDTDLTPGDENETEKIDTDVTPGEEVEAETIDTDVKPGDENETEKIDTDVTSGDEVEPEMIDTDVTSGDEVETEKIDIDVTPGEEVEPEKIDTDVTSGDEVKAEKIDIDVIPENEVEAENMDTDVTSATDATSEDDLEAKNSDNDATSEIDASSADDLGADKSDIFTTAESSESIPGPETSSDAPDNDRIDPHPQSSRPSVFPQLFSAILASLTPSRKKPPTNIRHKIIPANNGEILSEPTTTAPSVSSTSPQEITVVVTELASTPATVESDQTMRPTIPAGVFDEPPTTLETRLALDVLESEEFAKDELPPALPNLRIIPFVAADAVVNRFTDEISVEKLKNRYGLKPSTLSGQEHGDSDACTVNGSRYDNGELVQRPVGSCSLCRCYFGRVLCQDVQCPAVPSQCRQLHTKQSCCPKIVCDKSGVDKPIRLTTSIPYSRPAELASKPESSVPVKSDVTSRPPSKPSKKVALVGNKRKPVYIGPNLRPPAAAVEPLADQQPAAVVVQAPSSGALRPPAASIVPLNRRIGRPGVPTRNSVPLIGQRTRRPALLLDSLAYRRGSVEVLPSASDGQTLQGSQPARRPILPPSFISSQTRTPWSRPVFLPERRFTRPIAIATPPSVPAPSTAASTSTTSTTTTTTTTAATTEATTTVFTTRAATTPTSSTTVKALEPFQHLLVESPINKQFNPNSAALPVRSKPQMPPFSRRDKPKFPLTRQKTSTAAPVAKEPQLEHQENSIESSEPETAANKQEPFSLFGSLKLSGCNIFGRMYAVNTVVLELSDACTQCRCTYKGVDCTQRC